MVIVFKSLLLASLILVLYQDWKERQVHLFLFPLIGILSGFLYFTNTLPELFYVSVFMNLIFVSILMTTVYIYAKFKLKIAMLKTIGVGDLIFFFVLCASFSTISFMILFIGALVFSLIIHLILKRNSNSNAVPLAGYMSLFFSMTYMAFWLGIIDSLYTI